MNNNNINYSNNNINYSNNNNINNNSNITSSIINNSLPNNNSNIYYSQINDPENPNINYNNINSNRNSITQNSNSIPLSYNNNYQSFNNDKYNKSNYYSNKNNIALTEELKNNNLDNTMTSGVSESYLSGVSLIETDNKKFIPIDYTSQSFFIDKEYLNLQESRNEKTNNQPMQLKGDFEKLLDNNNMFMKNKSNTRIQITNAAYPVERLIQNELNKGNIRPDQENLREIIGENVVRKCDKDIYSNNDGNNKNSTSIRKSKDIDFNKKYSMSFPIKENNVLKWEFLNNIKGKRYIKI